MNLELLAKVVDHIEQHPEEFYMSSYLCDLSEPGAADLTLNFHRPFHCGTVGCIAGVTIIVSGVDRGEVASVKAMAADLLDLDPVDAEDLFEPSSGTMNHLTEHPEEVRSYVEKTLNVTLPKP